MRTNEVGGLVPLAEAARDGQLGLKSAYWAVRRHRAELQRHGIVVAYGRRLLIDVSAWHVWLRQRSVAAANAAARS
jgi:hypothetical protein